MNASLETFKEIREAGGKTENLLQQKLEDATYKPESFIEQTGDYKQSEAIQKAVTGMMDNAVTRSDTIVNASPQFYAQSDTGRTGQTPEGTGAGRSEAILTEGRAVPQDAVRPILHAASGPIGDVPQPVSHTVREAAPTERRAAAIDLMVGTANMQEMQMSFNMQYLMLQNKISHENRQFSMVSNMIKNKHDTAKNSINNIR